MILSSRFVCLNNVISVKILMDCVVAKLLAMTNRVVAKLLAMTNRVVAKLLAMTNRVVVKFLAMTNEAALLGDALWKKLHLPWMTKGIGKNYMC